MNLRSMNANATDEVNDHDFNEWLAEGRRIFGLGGTARANDVLQAALGYIEKPVAPATGGDNPLGADADAAAMSARTFAVRLAGLEHLGVKSDTRALVTFSANVQMMFKRKRATTAQIEKYARAMAVQALSATRDPQALARRGVRLAAGGAR